MPLKNSQYNALMRAYNEKQARAAQDLDARREQLYLDVPELKTLRDALAENATARARARITKSADYDALVREAEALKARRDALQKAAGLGEEGLVPRYECPVCRDTGYVGNNKCRCFIRAAVELLYDQSNIRDILAKENFDSLSMVYYDRSARDGKRSQYDYMQEKIDYCRSFAENFDEAPGSLLFSGPTGTGKTFLSNCIAKALIDSCHSVVYFSAVDLFERFSKNAFDRYEEDEEPEQLDQYVLESDLLIIDDLGTELINRFTVEKLFYIINERVVRHRSTIISTNLTPGALRDEYTERIASRILSNYELIQFSGEDIRIKKRFGR